MITDMNSNRLGALSCRISVMAHRQSCQAMRCDLEPWGGGKKIVITTFGFIGALDPYLALARRLKKEGHYLVIATSEYYRATVKKAGIDFYPVRPDIDVGDHNFVSLVMEPRTGSDWPQGSRITGFLFL